MTAPAPRASKSRPVRVSKGTRQRIDPSYQIDSSFDVAGVSELAHRERSAFKPVYSMNRWWARRSSAVFRAILLGLLDGRPVAQASGLYVNALEEYPEASDQVVLDPFMGGGTTVVEALRVGFRTVGVDLNPLAWFIVRNECTAVDLVALDAAFDRVRKSAEKKIQNLYSTQCPHCEAPAQIVHTFWAKLGACGTCDHEVEMRRDWLVGRRRNHATVTFHEASCPSCNTSFDAETHGASVTYAKSSNVRDPGARPWVTVNGDGGIECPSCGEEGVVVDTTPRSKKLDLFAVQCPRCRACSTERGPTRAKVDCPQCDHRYEPADSNTGRGTPLLGDQRRARRRWAPRPASDPSEREAHHLLRPSSAG